VVEHLESRTLLSSTLSEGLGTATIQGVVYNDANGNGVMDVGELPSPNVAVSLSQVGISYAGTTPPTVTTDAAGNFSFTSLAAAQYQVRIVPDVGLVQDAPGVVDITVTDSAVVNYNVGETNNINRGGSGGGSVTGTLFNDFTQSGIYNPVTEQFLSGDTVYLDLDGSGVLKPNDPTAITNNVGQYTFPPGLQSIQSLAFTSNTTGGTFVLDVSDASVSPAIPTTATAPIVFNPNNAAANALAIQTAINAIDPNGGVVVTAGADVFHYTVTYNLVGLQTAIATDPATALTLSAPTTGIVTVSDVQDGTLNPPFPANLPSIQMLTFGPLTSGGTFALDFGDSQSVPVITTTPSASIPFDPNNTGNDNTNNIRNALNVLDPNGGVTVANGVDNFHYIVTYSLPGPQPLLRVDPITRLLTAPSPLTETIIQAGSSAVPTGVFEVRVVPRTGFHQDPPGYRQVTVYSDQTVTQDIGENNRTTITGVVFEDLNGNGVQDPGDVPVAGEFVFIDLVDDGFLFNATTDNRGTYNASTGTFTNGDPFTTTDVNGRYSFTGLAPGIYRVEIQSTAGLIMDNPQYRDAILNPGEDLTLDLPEGLPASVSGTVFDDKNANGILDPGEPGVANQNPFLDVNSDGILEGNPIGTDGIPLWYAEPNAITGVNGGYSLPNLAPGTYTLRELFPPGALATGPKNASHSFTFTLGSGQNLTSQNFGYQTPDLTISALNYPTRSALGGAPLKAVARITNVGNLTAIGSAGISLYAQTTNTGLDTATAIFVGTFGTKAMHLAPGQSRLITLNFNYPTQTPTGSYFIYALVVSNVHDNDAPNDLKGPIGPVQIIEPVIDLTNRYAAQPLTTVAPGQPTALALAVTNNGNVTSSGELAFRVYLTTDPVIEPNDVVAQTFFFKNVRIKPGRTRVFVVLLINPGANLGFRYVITDVDSGDPLGEINLANNFAIPDLQTLFK
jgi:hypothetical protein